MTCLNCIKILIQIKRNSTEWSTDQIRRSRPGVEGYDLPPLTEKLKNDVQVTFPASVSSKNYDTHITKLDNGLRVASEKLFGEFCTVGGNFTFLKRVLNIIR